MSLNLNFQSDFQIPWFAPKVWFSPLQPSCVLPPCRRRCRTYSASGADRPRFGEWLCYIIWHAMTYAHLTRWVNPRFRRGPIPRHSHPMRVMTGNREQGQRNRDKGHPLKGPITGGGRSPPSKNTRSKPKIILGFFKHHWKTFGVRAQVLSKLKQHRSKAVSKSKVVFTSALRRHHKDLLEPFFRFWGDMVPKMTPSWKPRRSQHR